MKDKKNKFDQAFEERIRNLDLRYAHLEQEVKIDKHGLDECLVKQPSLYAEVSNVYAEVISMHDAIKDRVKLKEAGAELNWRRHCEEQQLKCTDASVKAEVATNPDVRQARKQLISAIREQSRWEGLKESFRDRGYALRELASLWVANYYSKSSAGGPASREVQDRAIDENRKAIAERRKAKADKRRE